MKKLNPNDYVIFDRKNNELLCFSGGSDKVIIYNSKEQAEEDLYDEEEVISCTELPMEWQDILSIQINK